MLSNGQPIQAIIEPKQHIRKFCLIHRVVVGLLLAFCSSVTGDGQETKTVRVGANFAVPWAYLSADGTPTGFFVEVMREVARREGAQVDVVLRRDGVEPALLSGEVDIWAGAVSTEERRRKIYFTEPWWSLDHYVAVMESSGVRTLENIAARQVLYAPTPPFTVDIRQFLPHARLRPVSNLRDRFLALCSGETDAILFYQETALFGLTGANEMLECRQRGVRIIPVTRPVMQLSIAAHPGQKTVADRFRSHIAQMMRDQTISKLPSFRMTGDNSMVLMLQAERSQYRQRMLQVSLAFALGLVLLSVVAYARLRLANARTVQALDLAKQAAQAKGEFLAVMSHEIRTPMTAVLGYMDMLLNTPLRHDQRQFAIEVSQATASLLTMLTTVLDYSRSLGGTLPLQQTEFDLASVIDDSIAGVLLQAESKGLEVTVQLDQQIPAHLIGDPVRIRHMVSNLVTNAVKFTEHGWLRVDARFLPNGPASGTLEISVADSGVGISKEKQRLIFLPFTQVDSTDTRSAAGIGLGLAIVSDLSKQLGGSVTVESEPNAGSRFILALPVRRNAEEPFWLDFLRPLDGSTALILCQPSRQVAILEEYLTGAGFSVLRPASIDEMTAAIGHAETSSRIFCIADGREHGLELIEAVSQWRESARSSSVLFILLGSMHYLSGQGQEVKGAFDRVLPLPAGRRALSEAFLPQSVPQPPAALIVSDPILVVDDNPVNRRVLAALLEKLGCAVETANNGAEGLAMAVRRSYALILMDCQMPEMNGYEATEAIRKDPILGATARICGLSAAVDPQVREKCLAAGMNDYISKPVTLDSLRELVVRHTQH
jgi:signal transduction histidine kinase/CheY-like chemotaxis protein